MFMTIKLFGKTHNQFFPENCCNITNRINLLAYDENIMSAKKLVSKELSFSECL